MSDKKKKEIVPEVLPKVEMEDLLRDEKSIDYNDEDIIDLDEFEHTELAKIQDVFEESNLPTPLETGLTTKELKGIDPLTLYLKEISRYDLLSQEQEAALTKALVETGDLDVAKKLVTANLRLVVKIAMEYRSAYQNVMDLIQEGNIGLMKAVSKYDPEKGAKLSYYASWWIRSYILKFILDNFRLVKIGTTNDQKKLFYNLLREKERLISLGINPDNETLSKRLGVSEKSVALMDERLGPSTGDLSIDRPISDDGSGARISDFLEDDSDDIAEKLAHSESIEILRENLVDFIDGLKPRDQEIFKKRLLSEVPPSLQAIADEYGVSRERIRQIEERLLNNLKVYMSEHLG
ncbi:putative alternative sigma factor RpoH [Bacteriovorax sp. BSW11_IV]|uniref:RNA polymerase factor sigma-32 n=1 Tax=Bacteriovorax sp. BSW11_IV TaxID=1353529 RepID=UPI000389DC51|nr:RNA polymerase factor sigma-32 [Bacteriovorax sp. BSW11_IV]EQC48413.1 putative alternative sigma factor RpoH [Bacteriovorax sp. BSW11_IV]